MYVCIMKRMAAMWISSVLVVVAAVVLQSSCVSAASYYDASASVTLAREILKARGINNTKDRLPIMMLYSHEPTEAAQGDARNYYVALKCSLLTVKIHLQPSTPTDVYFFVKKQYVDKVEPWILDYGVIVIPLEEKVWDYPSYVRPENTHGWSGGFSKEYRLMGHWRLAFQFEFARALGYDYLFQFDSDSYIVSNVTYNLVDFMRKGGYWVTNKNYFFYEIIDYFRGLPELARFWLVTRRGRCDTQDLHVQGALFNKLGPEHNVTNLYTPVICDHAGYNNAPSGKPWDGWMAKMIAGNYNIFNLHEFWFSDDVQDFIHLVLRIGAHIEHRWVDVSTESMAIDLFVPPAKFHIFEDHRTDHGRGDHAVKCWDLWPKP